MVILLHVLAVAVLFLYVATLVIVAVQKEAKGEIPFLLGLAVPSLAIVALLTS